MTIKPLITLCILEIVPPESNDHLVSSSLVAPFWRETNAEKIIHSS